VRGRLQFAIDCGIILGMRSGSLKRPKEMGDEREGGDVFDYIRESHSPDPNFV
jgi:hypothetical protein